MAFLVILETEKDPYPIRPKKIDLGDRLIHAFPNKPLLSEEAYWVTRFCQSRKTWNPFSKEELAHFCFMNGMGEPKLSHTFGTDPMEWSYLTKASFLAVYSNRYFVTPRLVSTMWNANKAVRITVLK